MCKDSNGRGHGCLCSLLRLPDQRPRAGGIRLAGREREVCRLGELWSTQAQVTPAASPTGMPCTSGAEYPPKQQAAHAPSVAARTATARRRPPARRCSWGLTNCCALRCGIDGAGRWAVWLGGVGRARGVWVWAAKHPAHLGRAACIGLAATTPCIMAAAVCIGG